MQDQLQIQAIFTVQLHIHSHHLYTFDNTFFIQSLRQYNRGIKLQIVQHQHPLHQISELPFAIVNATHVVHRVKLLDLVLTIAVQRPVRAFFFRTVFCLAEEIATVGRILSQQAANPYFLLLSPYRKYQMYKHNNKAREQFYSKTQYLDPYTEELNKEHFIYKLDILSTYVNQIQKNPLVVLCIFALMKSLKIDNRMLYETLAKNAIFLKCEEDGFKLAGEEPRAGMVEARFIGTVPNQKEENKQEQKQSKQTKNIFNDARVEFLSRLAIPLLGFFVFWKVHKLQSVDVL